jgi:hypothetical protein
MTFILPFLTQFTPLLVAVNTQPLNPADEYVCSGFCSVDDCPSPKVHEYAFAPEQYDGVAVDWNGVDAPAYAVNGTVAVQVNVHGGEIEIEPFLVHVTVPSTVAV